MDRVTITIAPVPGGWSVASRLGCEPLMFLSAVDAEAQARRFAGVAVGSGCDVEIRLQQRGGDVSVQAYTAHRSDPRHRLR